MPNVVALVPARRGSRRVPGKNVKPLGGRPLLVWSIESALASEVFSRVIVCTDSIEYSGVARYAGAETFAREDSPDDEPDIRWVRRALSFVECDAFAILRPTSPFRTAETIRRAWQAFLDGQPADSLRAVELVRQHPGKMWVKRGGRLLPLLPFEGEDAPWHSSATQTLPRVYIQTAGLEIAWAKTVRDQYTIGGTVILPFSMPEEETLDVNTPEDWERAERLVTSRRQGITMNGPLTPTGEAMLRALAGGG